MTSEALGKSNAQIETLNRHFETNPTMTSTYTRPSALRYPSHRSGFVSGRESSRESSPAVDDNDWRPPQSSSAWYRHQPYVEPSRSRQSSPDGREGSPASLSDIDFQYAKNLPLPRGSLSPMKEMSPEVPSSREDTPMILEPTGDTPKPAIERSIPKDQPVSKENYIRFSLRADVQQQTVLLETAVELIRDTFNVFFGSIKRIALTALSAFFLFVFINMLFGPPAMVARPDVIKLAHFTKNFEPLIHYSENGIVHLEKIQETGTAVWDLGEAIRIANMSSSALIGVELDEMAEGLNKLALELTGFFASIDGDFDNILLTLEWAQRELLQVQSLPIHKHSWAVSNLHSGLSKIGLLSATDASTRANQVFVSIFGHPGQERARIALRLAFDEIVATLEYSIKNELKRAGAIFSLYASIENQFENLHRIALREQGVQVKNEEELLPTLWEWALGRRASTLHKFRSNRILLEEMLGRTRANKKLLLEHNTRISALRQSLENIRRRLMSPLLRLDETGSSLSAGMGLEGQIESLEETGRYLKDLRSSQKKRVMDHLYGVGKDSNWPLVGSSKNEISAGK